MSCTDSCALFYKKKSVCVSDPCAAVGLACRSYGAGDDVFDCQEWCCERDTSTLAIFVVVIIIIVICCAFCCAFAVYRFVLRKKNQAELHGVAAEEVEIYDADEHPTHRKRRGHKRESIGSARSDHSSFTTSSYGNNHQRRRRQDEYMSSSQGKTNSGEQQGFNVGYDEDYSESGYTGRSRQTAETGQDQEYFDDAPATGFLDEASVSPRSTRSAHSRTTDVRRKQLNDSGDYYYEEQYSARSGQSTQSGQGTQFRAKDQGVWNGDDESHYYQETPRSAATRNGNPRSPRNQLGQSGRSEDNLFSFEDDF